MDIKKNKILEKFFNELEITLVDSGFAKVSTEWNAEGVCSPFSRIYYIVEGEGFIKSSSQYLKLIAGNCYFIPADLTYDYWCETSLKQLFFHVVITEPYRWNVFFDVDSFGSFPVGQDTVCELIEHYKNGNVLSLLKLKSHLNEALYHFINQCQICNFFKDDHSTEVLQAMKYISHNLSMQLTIADIAANQFISESKLKKAFKTETGMSIGQYIDRLIFQRAEFLLSKTSNSMKSISCELGFCDQFYFSRRFQQKFGESPLAYRKRVKLTSKI